MSSTVSSINMIHFLGGMGSNGCKLSFLFVWFFIIIIIIFADVNWMCK